MKEPTFDSDGYPTEETLETIRKWEDNFDGLMRFVKKAWKYGDNYIEIREILEEEIGYGYSYAKKRVYLVHTFGWSGNEEIISALQDNELFWFLCWQESKRGGHYKFTV